MTLPTWNVLGPADINDSTGQIPKLSWAAKNSRFCLQFGEIVRKIFTAFSKSGEVWLSRVRCLEWAKSDEEAECSIVYRILLQNITTLSARMKEDQLSLYSLILY